VEARRPSLCAGLIGIKLTAGTRLFIPGDKSAINVYVLLKKVHPLIMTITYYLRVYRKLREISRKEKLFVVFCYLQIIAFSG